MEPDHPTDLLGRAAEEIRSLRRQIDHLKVKADGFDALVQLVGMVPRFGSGMEPDLAWRIDRYLIDAAGLGPQPQEETATKGD